MKKLLFILPILLVGCSGKYQSRSQAYSACNEWADKGGVAKYLYKTVEFLDPNMDFNNPSIDFDKIRAKTITKTRYLRFCELERETNQFLGGTYYKLKKSKTYTEKEIRDLNQTKIIKNFKY